MIASLPPFLALDTESVVLIVHSDVVSEEKAFHWRILVFLVTQKFNV
jgi:hypothetical protein